MAVLAVLSAVEKDLVGDARERNVKNAEEIQKCQLIIQRKLPGLGDFGS